MSRTIVSIWMLLVYCGASTSASSEEKRILFGAQTASDGSTYEIGFCARERDAEGKGPGHAFVVLRSFAGGKETEFMSAGFAPPKSKPVHGQGVIGPENYSDATQKCLVAETSSATYSKAKSYIASQTEFEFAGVSVERTEGYFVAINDCVTFMQSVANQIGLKVPARKEGWYPAQYIKAMMTANN